VVDHLISLIINKEDMKIHRQGVFMSVYLKKILRWQVKEKKWEGVYI